MSPSKEMMSWVSPASSIKILCSEKVGSGLPGFTFLACTNAHTHACTRTHTHKSAHKFAHIHDYIHVQTNKGTPVRACVRERDSVCVCVCVRERGCACGCVCVKVSVRVRVYQ